MLRRLALVSLCALLLLTMQMLADTPAPVGRWEIVNTSGDNSTQLAVDPGGFSVYLNADGSAYVFGTFADSLCVVDAETYNVVPSWRIDGDKIQITIAVDNLGLGPDMSFIYTGTFNPKTRVPGSPSLTIPAISGTYFPVGDGSGCTTATQLNPGTFVATFFPTITSGTATGTLDAFTADHGFAFDSAVDARITFGPPPAGGQISGEVNLLSEPTFHGMQCFAATNGTVNPLTINPARSSQSGVAENMFADGFDPNGQPTTLFLNGFSADIYSTGSNTDPYAQPIGTNEWAAEAAIGLDAPRQGPPGVMSDGANTNIVSLYGVIGGACDGAGGVDSPFHFIPRRPIHQERRPVPPRFGRRDTLRLENDGAGLSSREK